MKTGQRERGWVQNKVAHAKKKKVKQTHMEFITEETKLPQPCKCV
jgi:hypothetical protein